MRYALRFIPLVITLVIVGAMVRPAAAQRVDVRDAFLPELAQRDHALIVDGLSLDEDAASIMLSLLDDYLNRFHEAAQAARERMASFQTPARQLANELAVRREEVSAELKQAALELEAALKEVDSSEEAAQRIQALRERIDTAQEELRQLAERRPPRPTREQLNELMAGMSSELRSWYDQKRRMREHLAADVVLVLDESQEPLWPAVDRRLRRRHAMGDAVLSGEGVDPFLLISELGLAEPLPREVVETIEQHKAAIDEAVRLRRSVEESTNVTLIRLSATGDQVAMKREIEQRVAAHVRLRDAIRAAVLEIAAMLPDESGRRLHDLYRRRSFPQVYGMSRAERDMRTAVELLAAYPQDAARVGALLMSYQAETGSINDELAEATREAQPAAVRHRMLERVIGEAAPMESTDPRDAVQARLRSVEQRYLADLETVISADAFAALPDLARLISR